MRLLAAQRVRIGEFGTSDIDSGWYVYVGSAKGGIKSRTGQHLLSRRENAKKSHYHIDYLRESVIEEIWFSYGKASLEHKWSQAIVKHFCAKVPVPGFGSSDCKAGCPAHFFRFTERSVAAVLRSAFKASANPILVEFARSPQRKTIESGYDSTSLAASYHRGRRYLEERFATSGESEYMTIDNKQGKSMSIDPDLAERLAAAMNLDAKSYKQDIRFAVAVEHLISNCGQNALDASLFSKFPQSCDGIKRLSRTSDDRQRSRIDGVITGRFNSIAPQSSDCVYDTVAFYEVPNRLRMARGTIIKCRKALSKGTTVEVAVESLALAKLAYRAAILLTKLLKPGFPRWLEPGTDPSS